MAFHFFGAICSESILGLSLNHFVDEIGRLDWPSPRHFVSLNLYLFWKNVVPDLFARFTNVGSSAEHAFVGHDSNGKVVYDSCMILAAHNFGSHVSWGSRSVLRVLWAPNSRYSKISNSHVAILVNDEVLRLDISMNNLFLVAVF